MPEGDTIARHGERLRPLLLDQVLLEVRYRGSILRDLSGDTVTAIDTHGKHLWIRFAGGAAAHVHLGMEGKWSLISADGLRQRRYQLESASLALVVARGAAICAHAPTVEILRGPDARRGDARLGPDILAAPPDVDGMLERAFADEQLARPLGEVVLDQRVVAGIGNVWKSELCYLEKLDPRAPLAHIERERLRALLVRAASMMSQNVAAGTSLRTTTVDPTRHMPPAGLGRYWVYRREGRPCARCRTPIEKIQQGQDAGRSTYFCPRCQAGA